MSATEEPILNPANYDDGLEDIMLTNDAARCMHESVVD